MRKAYYRDIIKRKISIHNEIRSIVLRSLSKSDFLPVVYKKYFLLIFSKLAKKSTIVRCHNFCNVTFKSRGVFRFFSLERFCLKQKVMYGLMPAIKYKVRW